MMTETISTARGAGTYKGPFSGLTITSLSAFTLLSGPIEVPLRRVIGTSFHHMLD
jgi:hypothetical protein